MRLPQYLAKLADILFSQLKLVLTIALAVIISGLALVLTLGFVTTSKVFSVIRTGLTGLFNMSAKLSRAHMFATGMFAGSIFFYAASLALTPPTVEQTAASLEEIKGQPVQEPPNIRLASLDPNMPPYGPVVGSILRSSLEHGYQPHEELFDEPEAESDDTPSPLPSSPVVKPRLKHDLLIVRPRPKPRKGELIQRSSVSGTCLPASIKRQIARLENRFGRIRVTSTFRRGARIAGTGRRSRHASCQAIDFNPPRGKYREVVNWLRANHNGGLGTYSCAMHHIHIDNGPRVRWHHCVGKNGVPRNRRLTRARQRREIQSE